MTSGNSAFDEASPRSHNSPEPLAALSLKNFILWILRRRVRLRVRGESMSPCLQSGQEVLVDLHAYKYISPQVGDIVYLRHPLRADTQMFKRVSSLEDGEMLNVIGDNPAQSSDSRQFGSVRNEHILGKLVCSFP